VIVEFLDSSFNSLQLRYKFRTIRIRNEFRKHIWSLVNSAGKCLRILSLIWEICCFGEMKA